MLGNDLMEIWHLATLVPFHSDDSRSIVCHFAPPVAGRALQAGGAQIVAVTPGPSCAAIHGRASRIASSKRHGGLITASTHAARRPCSIPSRRSSRISGLNE